MMPYTFDIWNDKRTYYAAGFLGLIGLAVAGWYGYSWYNRMQERTAYRDLAEIIEIHGKAHTAPSNEKWNDLDRALDVGARKHSSSVLHPYFLTFRADVLIEEGKQKEALDLMNKATAEIPKTQPLYYLYATKRALMNMDSDDTALQKQGRDELQALARDTKNPTQDMALYYAGLDARARGETDFKKYFQDILAHGNSRSYWHQMAQYNLKT